VRCAAWRIVTHLGGAPVTIATSVTCLSLAGVWREAGARALLVLVLSHLIVQAVKRTVGRPRPSRGTNAVTLIGEPDHFSFPSGHAAAAMSVALGLTTAVPQATPALAIGAVLVGFSRVALAVHYPGDVVAGQMIALATAAIVWGL
jgi:undecaprenyl-diphosphatase